MSKLFNVVHKDLAFDWSEFDNHAASDSLANPSRREDLLHNSRLYDSRLRETTVREVPPAPIARPRSVIRLRSTAPSPFVFFNAADENPVAMEQYRMVRTKIKHHPKKPQVVLLSSPSSGDGKTVTSINTAAAIAIQEGSSVLLIDGDWRRSRVSNALGIPPRDGLSEVIAGVVDLESALVNTEEVPNLFLLPSGRPRVTATEFLDSARWRSFVGEMRARFTTIIIDAPPVESTADYALLQLVCDGVLLVLRPDNSNRRNCAEAFKAVPKDKLLGVILNAVEDNWFWKSPFDAYYYQKPTGDS